MKIGLIVAMTKELNLLLPLLKNVEKREKEGYDYYEGQLGRHEIFLLQCGIGKVNAALSTDFMIRTFNPSLIVNTGVAGGADSDMHVLDLLVATAVAYHDVWCGPGTSWGAASGYEAYMETDSSVCKIAHELLSANRKFKEGLICSGDIFVSQEKEVRFIKNKFPEALAVDMESGAIAQVCSKHKVAFSIIRVISDTPGQAENISQYENFWTDAPKETFNVLIRILENIA